LSQQRYVSFEHRNIVSLELRHITTPAHCCLGKPIEVESIIAELQETSEGARKDIKKN